MAELHAHCKLVRDLRRCNECEGQFPNDGKRIDSTEGDNGPVLVTIRSGELGISELAPVWWTV